MSRVVGVFLIVMISVVNVFAQKSPVSWSIDKVVGQDNNLSIVITADIDDTWKIYSRETEEGGPIPTEITFEHGDNVTLAGEYDEVDKPVIKESELFMMNVATFSKTATFAQPIASYQSGDVVKASVFFMCCSGNQCLPPTEVVLEVTL